MKTHFTLLILIFAATLLYYPVTAQHERQDVIYMKSGSIYRGTIIEQVPGLSYKIQIVGGSIIVITAADVEKITKEPYPRPPKPAFHYRDRGYFFSAQAHLGAELGFSIINGYKINQFGIIGIGGGVDWMYAAIGKNTVNATGGYAPIYLYYGGDILHRKITPFYNVYAGYGFVVSQPNTSADYSLAGYGETSVIQGGPMGGLGFGVKFYALRHITNFTISADLAIQNAKYWNNSYGPILPIYGSPTGYYDYSSSASVFIFSPALHLGIGF
jgi:hypothetical protein